MTPRMQIVWDVLESAKDCQDEIVIAACRRVIVADRIGRTAQCRDDLRLINAFAHRED